MEGQLYYSFLCKKLEHLWISLSCRDFCDQSFLDTMGRLYSNLHPRVMVKIKPIKINRVRHGCMLNEVLL